MIKIPGLCLLLCLLTSFQWMDDIYLIEVRDIQGKKITISDYKGKKILFVVLPLFKNDSLMINELTNFQKAHADSLAVIGILSNELGYSPEKENEIKKMYKEDRSSNIVITEGMNAKKGAAQSLLLQWLTDKNKNKRFNNDVRGVGYKFFVDETGKLYATIGPELHLSHPIFIKILNKPVGK